MQVSDMSPVELATAYFELNQSMFDLETKIVGFQSQLETMKLNKNDYGVRLKELVWADKPRVILKCANNKVLAVEFIDDTVQSVIRIVDYEN